MISNFAKLSALRRLNLLIIFSSIFCLNAFSQGHEDRIEMKAFPNPTQGNFTIKSEIPLDQLETILITDNNGRVIHGFTVESSLHTLEFDFHNHPAGEYFVHLLFKNSSERLRIQKTD